MIVKIKDIKNIVKKYDVKDSFLYVNMRVYEEVMKEVSELNSLWGFVPTYQRLGLTLGSNILAWWWHSKKIPL